MRTSHKEMRRKINAEVSKITDEELFSSAAFAAHLTDIAEAVTKRYKRRLRVETIYDTSENAMIACTNNRNILKFVKSMCPASCPTNPRILSAFSFL